MGQGTSMPVGAALPAQPDTFGALAAMRSLIFSECLIDGATPFAPLSAADAARYGIANALFIGRPKDFNDAYLPQLSVWIPVEPSVGLNGGGIPLGEAALVGVNGRAAVEFEAVIQALVDMRADWYAGEQLALRIHDALWSALLRHERLAGMVPSVTASEPRAGRGLGYEQIAGVEYRLSEVRWWARQEWLISGGRVI